MLPINGKYTTIRYNWTWIVLVRVMKEYYTSTSIHNGDTWDNSMMNHDNNTREKYDAIQLNVEFENVSMYNTSPTRWDGRGVSTDRFHRAILNTHPIWMNWKGTYDLAGIKPMTLEK